MNLNQCATDSQLQPDSIAAKADCAPQPFFFHEIMINGVCVFVLESVWHSSDSKETISRKHLCTSVLFSIPLPGVEMRICCGAGSVPVTVVCNLVDVLWFLGLTRLTEDRCPSSRWNAMCRPCCEYQLIQCRCPSKGLKVGYTVPCCRNALDQCDPCLIPPGTHSGPPSKVT